MFMRKRARFRLHIHIETCDGDMVPQMLLTSRISRDIFADENEDKIEVHFPSKTGSMVVNARFYGEVHGFEYHCFLLLILVRKCGGVHRRHWLTCLVGFRLCVVVGGLRDQATAPAGQGSRMGPDRTDGGRARFYFKGRAEMQAA